MQKTLLRMRFPHRGQMQDGKELKGQRLKRVIFSYTLGLAHGIQGTMVMYVFTNLIRFYGTQIGRRINTWKESQE